MDRPRLGTSGIRDIRNGAKGLRRHRAALAAGLAGILVGTLAGPTSAASSASPTAGGPASVECPTTLTGKATCYTGQDSNGAYYAIAVPKNWNGSLVMHAHGGPDLGARSDPARSIGDLERWSVMVDEGYAWAGSSYRRGGYGTRMAAADTENCAACSSRTFDRPRRDLCARPVLGRQRRREGRGDVRPKNTAPTTAPCSPTACSAAAPAATTTAWTCGWSTSTTAEPPSPDRAPVPAVGGAARGLDHDERGAARPP